MKASLPLIGKHELMHLPQEGIFNIQAKIDTGADKCSIWATDIEEKNGILSFTLFGQGSVLYTGKKITTSEYVTIPVRNSFGVTELRYMVRLSIELGNKKYKIRFTLADRSMNKSPVLIGMNFLKNRYLVNVSENYIASDNKIQHSRRVIVLSSNNDAKRDEYFSKLGSLHEKKTTYTTVSLEQLVYWFADTPKITIGIDGEDIKNYKLAYLKSYKRSYDLGITAADYLQYHNVRVIDDEAIGSVSISKLSENMRFNIHGIAIPKGIAMPNSVLRQHFGLLKDRLGLPFVLKDVYSEKGKNNYLINAEDNFLEIIEASPDCYFLAQEYIPNTGFYRLLVMNKDVSVIIKRDSHPHTDPLKSHLNKPTGGVNAQVVTDNELSEASSLAMRASVVMRRPLAGVDAIQDVHTKKWYILEANSSPQLMGDKYELVKAKALAKFIDYELERS